MSPFSRIAISKLPESRLTAVSASGLNDRDAGFLDERRRDDEKDQQIRREVEHRRKVDARIFAILVRGVATACLTSLLPLLRRGERDVVDAAEMHLVDDLDQRARGRLVLREDQHAAIGIHCAHPLDVGAHGAHVDCAVVDPDLAVLEDLDLDALRLSDSSGCLERRRPIDLQARLFDEDGRDDEKDQQIGDEIQHRREVDAGLFLICAGGMSSLAHG